MAKLFDVFCRERSHWLSPMSYENTLHLLHRCLDEFCVFSRLDLPSSVALLIKTTLFLFVESEACSESCLSEEWDYVLKKSVISFCEFFHCVISSVSCPCVGVVLVEIIPSISDLCSSWLWSTARNLLWKGSESNLLSHNIPEYDIYGAAPSLALFGTIGTSYLQLGFLRLY